MQVNGPRAQITAAGHGHLRGAEAAEQSADEVVGGTDLAGQFIGDIGAVHAGTVDLHRAAVDGAHMGAQFLQDLEDQRNIADLGDVFDAAGAVYQQSRRDNGNSGVFRAADIDFTMKGLTALDYIF